MITARKNRFCLLTAFAAAAMIFLFCLTAHAETYDFELKTSIRNNYETATLTARDQRGQTKWVYFGGSYPATELSHFKMILNDGYVYLVENGAIKLLDFYTGAVKWTNYDFGGSPAENAYEFSSSGKLYIGGYYGPDLFVVDRNGKTICRVNSLLPGSYWLADMWWYGGDDMRVIYDSDHHMTTFNVLDYFGRMDGL